MTAPIPTSSGSRIELSVVEARTRFLQLVRLARLTRQVTVVAEHGQPIAAIVAPDMLDSAEPGRRADAELSAAGWARRVETVREEVRRQHAARAAQLLRALDETWQLLDELRPPGSDRHVDALRATHAELRERR